MDRGIEDKGDREENELHAYAALAKDIHIPFAARDIRNRDGEYADINDESQDGEQGR